MPESLISRLRAGFGRLVSPPSRTTDRADGAIERAPSTMPLPPARLRAGGAHFRADSDFMASAVAEADLVISEAGSERRLAVLDVGCGAGRLAYGLIERDARLDRYEGVDVMTPPIEWCATTITPRYDRYRFRTIDVYNGRYNPAGARSASEAGLPFEDASFNVAYAYSVFSHMLSADVQAYLDEICRLLSADGVAVITAFVEDDVPDEEVNPPGYMNMDWGGTLHCVRFSRTHLDAMVRASGLEIARFAHGQETDGQSRLILVKVATS